MVSANFRGLAGDDLIQVCTCCSRFAWFLAENALAALALHT